VQNRIRYKSFDQISFADVLVYSKLPSHPFWSHIEKQIDFSFADNICAVLYTGRGQYPFAPSLKLKIHLIQSYYMLSDRQTEERIIGDLFIKRFLQLPVDFFGFDHSTIGLDRSRMGTPMFQACHLYILAQMYSKGLWGDKDEQWIIDSFPSNIGLDRHGAQRIIQQAMMRIIQHLKRTSHGLYDKAQKSITWDALTERLNSNSTTAEHMLLFSKLVAQAYSLLQWFEHDDVTPLLAEWKYYPKSQELQAVLKRILEENSRPFSSENEPETSSENGPDLSSPTAPVIEFEKIPRKQRKSDRIENACDPQARTGQKNKKTVIRGYKTQNLCTNKGVILDTMTIPANEQDGDAMYGMVKQIRDFFRTTPQALVGDTAYGHGKYRLQIAKLNMKIVAPVADPTNPTKLFGISRFTYDEQRDVFMCPNNAETNRKYYTPQLEGSQYHFGKKECEACILRDTCTTNAAGRTVFRSDYANIYEDARLFNETDQGKSILAQRNIVERKNQELKNNCGMGRPKAWGREHLQIKATIAAMVVNLKHSLRTLVNPSAGFKRRVNIT